MGSIGAPELIIVLLIVLLLFGGAKLPKLARSLGEAQRRVIEFIKTRGFNCNLFLAMFLLEALYDNGAAEYGQALLLGQGEDSPLHMTKQGATTTWEAWALDQKWNTSLFHPAGAFTGYIISSRIMGITPLAAGFSHIRIKPNVGSMAWGEVTTPTLYGPIQMTFAQAPDSHFRLVVTVPPNTTAQVWLPTMGKADAVTHLDGGVCSHKLEGTYACIDDVCAGCHILELV
jgi:TatA/E family protein of Tat protein translocase